MGLTPKDGDPLVPERLGRLDPKAFAANCNLLLDDRDAWAQQAQRGVALAARYSWERCARETAGVFEETLARFMRP